MPLSIFDSSASNLSTQSAMESYTHGMQAHALSQISSLDLSENHKLSDRNSDDIPTSGQTPEPIMPVSIFDSSAGNPSAHTAIEAYTHAMQAHALSQILFLKPCENHGIGDKDSDDVPTSGVLYQGPDPPIAFEVKAAGQAANGAVIN